MIPFARGSMSFISRGLPPLRTSMIGFPVRESSFTRFLWFSDRARSERLPGVSQYEFSPMHAYWKERTITAMAVRRVMDWTKKRGGQLGGTVKTGAGKLRRFAGSAKRFFQRQYAIGVLEKNL